MISNPEVNRTLATLRKAEFGFLGVIVEKLTDKPPLLPLYRTVHEIFTSYGSSFNSFEFIGSFSASENPLPSSTLSRRVTRTNLVTFSSSNGTLSIFDSSPRRRLFSLPNICGSNHDPIIRTRDLLNEGYEINLIDFSIKTKVLCEIFGFFLFLYPYPVGAESIENLFFCMNRSYSIPIPSRYLPRKISNWIPN